jgi:hypothetical protein
MGIQRDQLENRAQELAEVAEARGVQWREHVDYLPEGDVVARIGLLASLLGVSAGVALDPGVALDDALPEKA